jgi:Fe-S cluster biosynthesis and repair protein YggX
MSGCCGGGGTGEGHKHHHEDPAAAAAPKPGTRMVKCAKLSKELPALAFKPFNDALGQRIHDTISQQGWKMWLEYAKILLNEYRLNLAAPEAQKFLKEQCEQFFFGEGAALPPEYVPMASGK